MALITSSTIIPGRAVALEWILDTDEETVSDSRGHEVPVPVGSDHLGAIVTTVSYPDDVVPASSITDFGISFPGDVEKPHPNVQIATSWDDFEPGSLVFYFKEQGTVPFQVNFLAIYKTPPPPQSPIQPPPFKCRVCKSTAKALALAIVAAAVAGPSGALLAAVNVFLGGVGGVAAGAFVASVLGDTAAVIAEKLCKAVGLC